MTTTAKPDSPAAHGCPPSTLDDDLLQRIDAWWRAANYLSVGQIYLLANPLLREPLSLDHVKPRLLGHWGTTPGLNFVYVHLMRLIRERDLDMIYVTGPGHGGPALVANTWLEGSYSERYPDVPCDEAGMQRLFKQFSFPGGIPSHVAPQVPGSINEGGELGYCLAHAYGAAFDNPGLIVACVVGDGEAETGPLATGWHGNKFLNPERDGVVLPILHLNGYKIAGPSFLARLPHDELDALLRGCGHHPYWVEGDDPATMHHLMAATLDRVHDEIRQIQSQARSEGFRRRRPWPMIVLRTPKGWTGPAVVDGKQVEGTFRSHQVPLAQLAQNPEHLRALEQWMRSYRPGELFDEHGSLRADIASLAPKGDRRMGANPHANGGLLLKDLELPDFRDHALDLPAPGVVLAESTAIQGRLIRDVLERNEAQANFRVFSPDETASNRWGAVFEVTDRCSTADILADDEHVSPTGRVMEVLSEHQCQGWLEGYLLTGRHGFFSSYEAFIHIVDSMFNQHAKWLDTSRRIAWRKPIASLNVLLSSHVWRQDHNGFSHQDPGFLDLVLNKKPEIVRVYLPPDANTLLSVTDHCLRSRHCVNVIVAGKQPAHQWLTMEQAIAHCTAGAAAWDWAGNDDGGEPDVVMACCGDIPTLETLAAVQLLRDALPQLRVRVVNVVDLLALQSPSEHPHGMPDERFDALFTRDKPVVFAFHGYPMLVHRLTYRRANHDNFHVHGFREEGTTTTPFDMTVLNQLDRFHLALAALHWSPAVGWHADAPRAQWRQVLERHREWICEHGEDMPDIREWTWRGREGSAAPADRG